MTDSRIELWDLWYPKAAATGLPFARGRLDATDVLYVHAAPPWLTVRVFDDAGNLLAEGRDLELTLDDTSPITRLTRVEKQIVREDLWPGQADLGHPIILPGGEVGILKAWRHAPDHSEWRWQVEFYNHR